MPNLDSKYKTIYIWESEASVRIPQNLFSFIGVSYQFVFKYTKSLNQVPRTNTYWLKALLC